MEGLQAFLLGGLAQSSLILAGLAVYWFRFSARVIGSLAGFGAGSLIAAVAFTLIPESSEVSAPETSLWLLIGATVFLVSDRVVESRSEEAMGALRSVSSSDR